MKKIIAIVIVIILVIIGVYFLIKHFPSKQAPAPAPIVTEPTPVEPTPPVNKEMTVIGPSAEGRDIVAYHFGEGDKELLFVGGIHGGYAWNTALVGYDLVDYLKENLDAVPQGLKVTVIPVLNPDGINKTIGTTTRFVAADVPTSQAKLVAGRFNGNTVDLNRNFDCDWQAEGKWQNKDVSGGTSAFSEPETTALKNYVEAHKPTAVVAWYSAGGGVFASNCHNGVSAETQALVDAYAKASGYKAYQDFDFYEITGDMMNWFAKIGVPGVSVLLTSHDNVEWTKNLAGIKAVFDHYKAQ